MRKLISLVICILMLQNAFAQKEVSEANTEKRTVSEFHRIKASSGIEVHISKGDREELAVSVGDLGYLDQVKTVVTNGVLKIYREGEWKFWNTWKNRKVRVYVSYTKLDGLDANSGASINGTDLQLNTLNAYASSGGLIKIGGKADEMDVDVSSGGLFRGFDFEAIKCKAEASSGGSAQLNVAKELSAKANSGGLIRYKGEGLIRDINTNSGGSVKRQN
ncbi:MAG: DUF2807 domain-containing protein [Sediminibacterium sp.]|nr:DUF2807 domain-containing protein [Sediminibacterium sp.]